MSLLPLVGASLLIKSGHGTKSRTCQIPLMEKFIEQRNAKSLDLSCVANSQRPAFVTDAAAAARQLQF
jgi:hypothetical protein